MSKLDVVRAWKDEDYRLSLSEAQRASLSASPVGLVELSDLELEAAAGGCCNASTITGCSVAECMTCSQYPCNTSYPPMMSAC
jgi:mersacidin/lichenicidin family type 2 lantibiotic